MATWSEDEIEAAVDAYHSLFESQVSGAQVVKKRVYDAMALRYGRSAKAYEFRFQNISHVLDTMGLPWVSGLVPAANVGPSATTAIKAVIERKGYFGGSLGQATSDQVLLSRRAAALMSIGPQSVPAGVLKPTRVAGEAMQFLRSPQVVAWVLEAAAGDCEWCSLPAPFIIAGGMPYLEVHHVRWLSQGGSDTVTNAVALCPNCHRRFHHGVNADSLAKHIIAQVPRLRAE
ncbi:HNH endonuclease [Hymenobacter humi]|uniref:HNH endonuclease n=1 Tax=Hymenobacter humi TaxID=1411620 RepID=A0ABW2UA47_9BACT